MAYRKRKYSRHHNIQKQVPMEVWKKIKMGMFNHMRKIWPSINLSGKKPKEHKVMRVLEAVIACCNLYCETKASKLAIKEQFEKMMHGDTISERTLYRYLERLEEVGIITRFEQYRRNATSVIRVNFPKCLHVDALLNQAKSKILGLPNCHTNISSEAKEILSSCSITDLQAFSAIERGEKYFEKPKEVGLFEKLSLLTNKNKA